LKLYREKNYENVCIKFVGKIRKPSIKEIKQTGIFVDIVVINNTEGYKFF
jgi:hypothetical protein